MARRSRAVGAGGPAFGRRDDRQGDRRDPVARRRYRHGAGWRSRQRFGRRRRAGTAGGGGRGAARPREGAPPASLPVERMTTPVPSPKASAPSQPSEVPAAAARGALGPPRGPGEKPLASPAVRRRAREAGVDLRQVRGSGPAGRIMHDDLDAFLQGGPQASPSGPARVARTEVETVKVIGLRRRIAQKMTESRRAVHFAYVAEGDVPALQALR